MESSGRFERIFFKMLKEQNIAGAGGALGTGSGFDPAAGEIDSSDWYAPGDARVPKVLGKGKVQTRKGSTGGKKKKKKKKTDGLDEVYLTGEDEEEVKAKDPVGMDTYWKDGDLKVTIKEVLKYLDDPDKHDDGKKVPVKEESTDKLKAILIAGDKDEERVKAAKLKHAVVVVVDMEGNWKSILDGNHRVEKATNPKYESLPDVADRIKAGTHDTLPVRELDLRTAPEDYKKLFNYEIEKEDD